MKAGGTPGQPGRLDAIYALSGLSACSSSAPCAASVFESSPSVLYGGAIFLFDLPGLLVCHWFFRGHLRR